MEVTHAMLIDPGMMLAAQLGAEAQSIQPASVVDARYSRGNKVSRLMLVGIAGATFAMTTHTEIAAADDDPCPAGSHYTHWRDLNDDGVKQIGEVTCVYDTQPTSPPATHAPTPTEAPTQAPTKTTVAGGGHTTTTIKRNRAPATTTTAEPVTAEPTIADPNVTVDDDHDGHPNVIDTNTGAVVANGDADDNSAAPADPAAAEAAVEADKAARGLDPTLTDGEKFIVDTSTNKALMPEIYDVDPTTTTAATTTTVAPTTTTIAATTTSAAASTSTTAKATTTTIAASTTTRPVFVPAPTVPSSTHKQTIIGIGGNVKGGKNNPLGLEIAGTAVLLAALGVVVAARRKRHEAGFVPAAAVGSPIAPTRRSHGRGLPPVGPASTRNDGDAPRTF